MTKPIRLQDISSVIANHTAETPRTDAHTRRAAVAAILREGLNGTEILFIRRAEREQDVWSGHMAFPGGHFDDTDADLVYTAMRETREEIGLDLSASGKLFGLLHNTSPNLSAGRPNLTVSSYVFAVQGEQDLRLNHEVDEVIWAPLNDMLAGKLHTTHAVSWSNQDLPAFDLGGAVVWGMTYGMVCVLLDLLSPGWSPH